MIKTIFVVSTGHTATKSLAFSLNKLPGITATHETYPNARQVSNQLWDETITRERALEILRSSRPAVDGVWVESNCLLWNCISLIDEIYEEKVAYIWVHRNPKDTIDSFMATGFYGKDKLPWEQRAHTGFIDIRSDSYGSEQQRYNCTRAYIVRTLRITEQISVVGKRCFSMSFEDMISKQSERDEMISFIEDITGVRLGLCMFRLSHERKQAREKLEVHRRYT